MTQDEKQDFRQFCEQATTHQLFNIIEKERAAVQFGGPDRWTCYQIALAVGRERGITTEC